MQLLASTERTPELPRGHRLEGGQTAEQQREDDQGDEGRDRRSQGNERQAEHRHHQPRSAQAADLAQPEGVVPEQVEGDPATQCYGRDRPQRIPDVREGLLYAQSDEDDPCYHWQVQVAVGVARKPRPLLSLRRREPPL